MNSLFERPFTFDRVTRIVFSIVIIGVLLYLITVLRNALLPFLIAWLLAYMMQPFVKFFQYKLKLKSRILAIVAVIISASLIIGIAAALVVPSVAQEAERTLNLMRTHNPADGTPQPGEHTECNQAARPEGLEHPVEHILHPFQHNDYIRDSVVFHFHPARL